MTSDEIKAKTKKHEGEIKASIENIAKQLRNLKLQIAFKHHPHKNEVTNHQQHDSTEE
jgi:hypothetical protein